MKIDITADVSNTLGFYVYAYIDPRDNSIFYIGKGVGSRAINHLFDKSESSKVARIKNIFEAGFEPRIDILAYQLRDDLEASRVESALIELMGIDNLTNIVKGRFSNNYPRRQLADIIMENNSAPADMTDSALLIRINKQFKYGISDQELYESTRGIWVVGERRNRANFAMAVYAGVIREVYEIDSWHRAGTTEYLTRDQSELAKLKLKRWEFIGKVASESIRSRYIGYSVAHLFRIGQQSPVVGVNLAK
ncbi:MAG: hypothetical protein U1C48_12865 [Methylotenera sp.]|nr:hypothetical protein [Methylotenera sp.]